MAIMTWLGPYMPANVAPSTAVTAAIVTVVLVAITTRLFCNLFLNSQKQKDGTWSVGMVPYWFPILGHIPAVVVSLDAFQRKLRDASTHGIFAISLGGSTHNLVYTPSLIKGVFVQTSTLENEEVVMFILNRVFGVPLNFNNRLLEFVKDLNAAVQRNLMREPGLGKMLVRTIAAFEEHIPNLVSFATSPVDQGGWERASDVNVIRHLAMPSLMGQDFMDNYPELLQDIWDMDNGFLLMVAGFPRWLPIPKLGCAVRAQERLIRRIADFHVAMDRAEEGGDPGSEWRDFSDISNVVRERYRVWRANKVPPHLRADLALLWAMNVNANTVGFWMIIRILATPGLVDRLRAEVEPHVQATQPENDLGVAEPARLKISLAGVRAQCPLLKSVYFECLRCDSATWSIKRIAKDFTITEAEENMPGGPRSFALKAGEFVGVPGEVHQSDPRYFPSPEQFNADRFLVQGPNGKVDADIGTLRPFGGGPSMCKGKVFAEAEVLAYVAAIISIWDFEPTSPEGWRVPDRVRGPGVRLPKNNVRARIRRRKLA